MPYFITAFCHAARSTSNEMPTNTTPLSLYSRYKRTTLGASLRQSGHQLAQKSSTTTFPFSWLNEKFFPAKVGNVKSGAAVPGFNMLVAYSKSASCSVVCACTAGMANRHAAINAAIFNIFFMFIFLSFIMLFCFYLNRHHRRRRPSAA